MSATASGAQALYRSLGYVDTGLPPRRVTGTIVIRSGPLEVDDTLLTWERIAVTCRFGVGPFVVGRQRPKEDGREVRTAHLRERRRVGEPAREDEQQGDHERVLRHLRAARRRRRRQLQPATTATTVRVRDGETLTTDGPFAETKEVLGGFYLFEADNLDDALAVAAPDPRRADGAVEVRPLVER